MAAFSNGFSAGFDSTTPAVAGDPLLGVPIEALRQRVGLLPNDSSKDTEIIEAFAIAVEAMGDYCDRVFPYGNYVETETHFQGTSLSLRAYPLDTVAAIISDDAQEPTFHVEKKTGRIKLDNHWTFHALNTSYTGGYLVLPGALKMVALTTFDAVWALASSAGGSSAVGKEVKKTVADGLSVEYFDPSSSSASGGQEYGFISASMTSMLDTYRRQYA